MSKHTTPVVKRTRRHVVVRMTPDQAQAWAKTMHGLPAPTRQSNKLRELADRAAELAKTDLPPAPKATSIKIGQGFGLRKGGRSMRKGDYI